MVNMKRVLLTLSYNGTAYHGWQIQPNAVTVQQILEEALFKLLSKETRVHGCSRTDAGVHAKMFCCHLDCEDTIPDMAFLKGLNSVLPDDIAVTHCKTVDAGFHARFNAKGKTYVYNILNNGKKDAFLSPFVWQIERRLDIDVINEFCKTVVGKHDFYGFSSSGRSVTDTVRTVSECYAEREDDLIRIFVTADGFLYNMVRIIVGTAVYVALGTLDKDCALKVFKTKERNFAGITAPAKGLFLEKVYYD